MSARQLCSACEAGDMPRVEQLLRSKTDPNAAARGTQPPLFEACVSGSTAVVELLLKHHAAWDALDDEVPAPTRRTRNPNLRLDHALFFLW